MNYSWFGCGFPIYSAPASGFLVEYNQTSVACFVEQVLESIGLAGDPLRNFGVRHVILDHPIWIVGFGWHASDDGKCF